MVFLKKYFVNPAKRQNFVDASGQIFSLILRPCHIGGHHFLLCQHTNTKDIAGQSANILGVRMVPCNRVELYSGSG